MATKNQDLTALNTGRIACLGSVAPKLSAGVATLIHVSDIPNCKNKKAPHFSFLPSAGHHHIVLHLVDRVVPFPFMQLSITALILVFIASTARVSARPVGQDLAKSEVHDDPPPGPPPSYTPPPAHFRENAYAPVYLPAPVPSPSSPKPPALLPKIDITMSYDDKLPGKPNEKLMRAGFDEFKVTHLSIFDGVTRCTLSRAVITKEDGDQKNYNTIKAKNVVSSLRQGQIPHKDKWALYHCFKPGGEVKGQFPFKSQSISNRVKNGVKNGIGYLRQDLTMVGAKKQK